MYYNGFFEDMTAHSEDDLTLGQIQRTAVLLGESDALRYYREHNPDDEPDGIAIDLAPDYSRQMIYALQKASLQFQSDMTHAEELHAHGFDAAMAALLSQDGKL